MSNQFGNPKAVGLDNLVFYYDVNNTLNSYKGQPTTNFVNPGTLNLYNNPGLLTTISTTGDTYKGAPVWKITYTPQSDEKTGSMIDNSSGVGAYHTMGTNLSASTYYAASIYIKNSSAFNLSYFRNNYSNLQGWGYNLTIGTKYVEGDWIRMYTQWYGNTNGYATGYGFPTKIHTVNTNSTITMIVSRSITSADVQPFLALYAVVTQNGTISNNGGLTGLAITNHGIETGSWTKLSYPSSIKIPSDFPYLYYIELSVPSTSGIDTNITLAYYLTPYCYYVNDNKFWKIAFKDGLVSSGSTMTTYWAAPMIEQKTQIMPSAYVSDSRLATQSVYDISKQKNIINVVSASFDNNSQLIFSGSSYMSVDNVLPAMSSSTLECVVKFAQIPLSNSGIIGYPADNSRAWSYPILGSIYIQTDGKIAASVISPSVPYTIIKSTTTTNTSSYYHLALTKDTIANQLTLYLNGLPEASTSVPSDYGYYPSGTFIGNTSTIEIGKYTTPNTASWGVFLSGSIPVAKVYNRALTSTEINQNYNAQKIRFALK